MWGDTRMVVLTAVTAAMYAAVLIPFKMIPLIPGTTELRPANALPVVFSILFGPAGAWGCAMGNLIGDTFGTLGPGTLFGFLGNLLAGYLPYRIWNAWPGIPPVPQRNIGWWARFTGMVILSSGSCALVIAWGLHVLGFVPFPALSTVIFMNNALFSLGLSPLLLTALYSRVRRRGMLHADLLLPEEPARRSFPRTGIALLSIGTVGGILLGDYLSWSGIGLALPGGDPVGWALLPALGLVALGAYLL